MRKRPPIVFLELRSWVGTAAIGAEHYYGKLTLHDGNYKHRHELELSYPMTQAEATYRNKKEHHENSSYRYKKGDETNGFATEQAVCERAVAVWRYYFHESNVLLEGSSGTLDPCKVLDAPPEFMERGNAIVVEAEKIGQWEGDEPGMKNLSKKWDQMLTTFAFDKWKKADGVWEEA